MAPEKAPPEAFPTYDDDDVSEDGQEQNDRHSQSISQPARSRAASVASERPHRTSIVGAFLASNPPNGMWQATGEIASKAPTLPEIRAGSFTQVGWTEEGQREQRGDTPHEIHRTTRSRHSSASQRSRLTNMTTASAAAGPLDAHAEHPDEDQHQPGEQTTSPTMANGKERAPLDIKAVNKPNATEASSDLDDTTLKESKQTGPDETGTYPNGYRFPPKHTWKEATVIFLKAFWKFTCTPFGFVVVIYGLNVVAWGAMIFFVLLNAAPAMCHPSCNARDSARKKWIEIDSQILNALFCVTGFGLAPWRCRDLYWLLHYRLFGSKKALRLLAGIYRGWFRLPGSDQLEEHIGPAPSYSKKNPQTSASPPPFTEGQIAALEANEALPLPATSIPPAPLTGMRAPPTKMWKLDFVIWMYIINSGLQVVLCVAMWNWNRYNRPSWLQAFAITVACLVAIAAGLVCFFDGKKVKAIEGISVHEEEIIEDIESQGQEVKPTALEEKTPTGLSRVQKKKGKHWYERH